MEFVWSWNEDCQKKSEAIVRLVVGMVEGVEVVGWNQGWFDEML